MARPERPALPADPKADGSAPSRDSLEAAESLLGCGSIKGNLLTRTMQRGGGGKRQSVYTIDYNKVQAEAARDAVVKALYTHLFDWVVTRVNANVRPELATL